LGVPTELVPITTEGDVNLAPLEQIGGTGIFVSAVREALLEGRIDLAVHSMKDLPTAPAEGIALAATPTREDPRDALCSREGFGLSELPAGARVGTGSPRRASQLLVARPDLEVVGIRGNVDTRLGRLADLDAVVLAAAGLHRAGRQQAISEYLDPTMMLPASAQGILAVECRAEELDSQAMGPRAARTLHDAATEACAEAERSFLATLEAGCTAPVGALAQVSGRGLALRGMAAHTDGSGRLTGEIAGSVEEARELGARLARQLLEDGAAELISGSGTGNDQLRS